MWWIFAGENWINCWRADAHDYHWWRDTQYFCVGIKEGDCAA